MPVAVYPGTFDPVHLGHVDIATRAAALFDRLIIAVYDRPMKSLLFPPEKRVEMMVQAMAHLPNVTVESYGGLTVDYVRAVGARVIVRGLRMIKDFELEYQMALSNRQLAPDIDTICLMTSLEYAFLSSTIVHEIAVAGGSVEQLVPPHVCEALRLALAQGTEHLTTGTAGLTVPE
ncbi:MAG TPA: pantetheine-phosphate adenylyltransferase [Anaerolineae bacterium]|nr:pantetheine-phosphate adenylyltransferase [Anaerolineae bacterium]